mmetsp:Transcript_583/g.1468  ORF Transcript_583/g.1468 Transcript_583/m.1468 type:complete len:285 (-) Transcript_583:1508-2362(-)
MTGGGDMASGAPRSKTFERPLIVGVLGYLQLLPRATGLRVLNDKTSAGKAAGEQEGDLSAALRRSMTTLYGRHLSEDGTQLDYGGMAASEEYAGYKALAEGLREVDTRSMGEEERVAFFINVYNCLVIDAIISLGEPKDLLSRLRMYAEAAYNIGGANFSLNDIENGVLRGNQVIAHAACLVYRGAGGGWGLVSQGAVAGLVWELAWERSKSCAPTRVRRPSTPSLRSLSGRETPVRALRARSQTPGSTSRSTAGLEDARRSGSTEAKSWTRCWTRRRGLSASR